MALDRIDGLCREQARNMWPVTDHLITLRVCHDLDWRVTASCPKCRISRMVWPDKTPARLQSVPLAKLFAQGAFTCSKTQYGCTGTPADRLTVDAMNVGELQIVAEWVKR